MQTKTRKPHTAKRRARPTLAADYVGRKFGNWTVTGVGETSAGGRRYECRCTCGNTALVHRNNLQTGASSQCNDCRLAELRLKRRATVQSRIVAAGAAYSIDAAGRHIASCAKCKAVLATHEADARTARTSYRCTKCNPIAYKPKYPVRLADIADLLGVTKAAVSRSVTLLGWRKYVKGLKATHPGVVKKLGIK